MSSCSGHGVLNADGMCVCDSGWADVGDFSPVPGLDCGINEQSIFGLAVTSLFLGVVSQVVFMRFLLTTLMGPVPAKRDGPSLKLRFAITYTIQTICCNVYDIAQIVDPRKAIFGQTIYITILMAVAYTTAYGGLVVFFEAIIKLLRAVCQGISKESQQRLNEATLLFFARTRYLYAICAVTGLVTLVTLVVPADACYVLAKTVFASWVIFHGYFMLSFNLPINSIRAELQIFIAGLSRTRDSIEKKDPDMTTSATSATSATAGTDTMPMVPITATALAAPVAISDDLTKLMASQEHFKVLRKYLLIAQVCINFVLVLTTILYIAWMSSDMLIRKSIYVILYCTIGVHIMSVPMLAAISYKPSAPPSTDSISLRVKRNTPVEKPTFSVLSRNTTYYEKVVPDESELSDAAV